jgi:hypothetical protein
VLAWSRRSQVERPANCPDFAAMWGESEVNSACEGVRRLRHVELGEIALEFSTLAVDGQVDLAMLVYTPVSADDAARIRALVAAYAG